MNHLRSLLFCACCFLGINATFAQQAQQSPDFLNESAPVYQPLQFKLGFNLGWTFPYSGGVELSLLFNELFDVNVGGGIGVSGLKYGAGARLYPLRNSKVSPMIGTYFYHATGTKTLNVSMNMDEAEFRITPDNAVLVNGGMRLRFGRGHYFTAAMGYVFPFEGEQAVRKWGSRNPALQNFANSLATSGFSFNVGILLKLSGGHYEK